MRPLSCAALFILLTLFSGTAPGARPKREPPPLFGGPRLLRDPGPVQLDPRLPTGSKLGPLQARPKSKEPAACSLRLPVCVHRGSGVTGAQALTALSALEQSYERLVHVLGLTAPLADGRLGGNDGLDWYLDNDAPGFSSAHDPVSPGAFDSSSAFCVAPASEASVLERIATQCVAEAIAWRLDAGSGAYTRRAYATTLWWIVGNPTVADVEAIDHVQRHPEVAIAGSELTHEGEGSAVFFDYLEQTLSASGPGVLSTALIAAAANETPASSLRWNNEPDVFDVLRHSLEENTVRMATLMADFAVARAFWGLRDDGTHPPGYGVAGSFGNVHFDWQIRFSSLPRRLGSGRPLEPTGSQYIWLDLDEVPVNQALGFQAEWEGPVAFQWKLVSIDESGQEIARIDVPFQERGRSAEARVVNLAGVKAILVIGTNMGGLDLAHPFDPDFAPFEPHEATVYLVSL